MIFFSHGSAEKSYTDEELRLSVFDILTKLGNRNRVLVIPPDITRFHSMAGKITGYILEYYKEKLIAILPGLGTHNAMACGERIVMYGEIPAELFFVHNWREDIITLGEVPVKYIEEVSEGKVHFSWPAQVNRLLIEGSFDLILSVGQVVPHEVAGMANYNKNIFIGTGGKESINKSHFLAAAYGMERIMGRTDTPVRKVLNYASENFCSNMPVVYIHTVVGRSMDSKLHIRGLFAGDNEESFEQAARLSFELNFEKVEKPLRKIIVFLDPQEYKSTWLGNKSIYRTRMAIADGGELIVLAPGLTDFGEDKEIDRLISPRRSAPGKTLRRCLSRTIQSAWQQAPWSPGTRWNATPAADRRPGPPQTSPIARSTVFGIGIQVLVDRRSDHDDDVFGRRTHHPDRSTPQTSGRSPDPRTS